MVLKIIILALAGALAFNNRLIEAGHNRQYMDVEVPIKTPVDIEAYQCRIGVPYGFKSLIGREVYFWTSDKVYGPFLITDVESDTDYDSPRGMVRNGLLADIDCPELVHKKGFLFLVEVDIIMQYVYKCIRCQHTMEAEVEFVKLNEQNKYVPANISDLGACVLPPDCPVCGTSMNRIYEPVGVIFSTSGFYSTDNKKK